MKSRNGTNFKQLQQQQQPSHSSSSSSLSLGHHSESASNLLIISGTSACKNAPTTSSGGGAPNSRANSLMPSSATTTTSRPRSSSLSSTKTLQQPPLSHHHPKLLKDLSIHSDVQSSSNSSDETKQEAQSLLNQWTKHNTGKFLPIDSSLNLQSNHLISNMVSGTSLYKNVSETPLQETTPENSSKFLERVKSKKPSQLSQWEKLRISMERKKPTLQLVDDIKEFENNIHAENISQIPTMTVNNLLSPSNIGNAAKNLRNETHDFSEQTSLFQYQPLSEMMSDQTISKETQHDSTGLLLAHNSAEKETAVSDSVEQQLQAIKSKLLGKDYKIEEKTLVSKKPSIQKTTPQTPPKSTVDNNGSSINYITCQKDIFMAENEKRKAEEEVQKIKRQLEEEKNKLKQVQQMKKQELKTIQQHQQM